MTNLRFIIAGVVVIVIGLVLFSSVYTVQETRQALILEFGQPRNEETKPGLHFKLPWQSAEFYDKRVLSLDPRRVLNGHGVPGEGHHLATERDVFVVEGRKLQRVGHRLTFV